MAIKIDLQVAIISLLPMKIITFVHAKQQIDRLASHV